MALQLYRGEVVHVRFEGRSLDVPLGALGSGGRSDADLKQAVARYLEVPEARLHDYVVDRHENGNLTIRPQAVFG